MANLRIDQLPPVEANTIDDLLPLSQDGVASHSTIEQVANSIHRYFVNIDTLPFVITYYDPEDSQSGVVSNEAVILSIPNPDGTTLQVHGSYALAAPNVTINGSRPIFVGDVVKDHSTFDGDSMNRRRFYSIYESYGFEVCIVPSEDEVKFVLRMEYGNTNLYNSEYQFDYGLKGYIDVLMVESLPPS